MSFGPELVFVFFVFGLWWRYVTDVLGLGGLGWANNVQHALDATRWTFMATRDCFKPDMQYWVHNPWAKKKEMIWIWKRFWDYSVTSFHSRFSPSIFKMDFGFEDVWRHRCDWSHDMHFENDLKNFFLPPFTSFHVVQRRRRSGPVRIYIYIHIIIVYDIYIYNIIIYIIYIIIIYFGNLSTFCVKVSLGWSSVANFVCGDTPQEYIYIYILYVLVYMGFPSMGVLQNGLFIMETPINLGVPLF